MQTQTYQNLKKKLMKQSIKNMNKNVHNFGFYGGRKGHNSVCYFICNSSIYILVFNIFVTFTILILSF